MKFGNSHYNGIGDFFDSKEIGKMGDASKTNMGAQGKAIVKSGSGTQGERDNVSTGNQKRSRGYNRGKK